MPRRQQKVHIFAKHTVRLCLLLAAAALMGGAIYAQTPAPPPSAPAAAPAYDVAVIKPNKTGGSHTNIMFGDYGNFSATNVSVKLMLQVAFQMRRDLIFDLPKWAEDEHFDIEAKRVDADAKSDAAITNEQDREMLQKLLIERFQLKSHKETRVMALYELIVYKGGSKMTPVETTEKGPSGLRGGGKGDVTGLACEMDLLAQFLSNAISSVVNDKTGLTGRYNFHLKWSPDETATTDDAPSIFTAVQEQLGLKLQPAKGPVEVLMVDHVERPSEN